MIYTMDEQNPEDLVEEMLSSINHSRPCVVERNKPLAAALRHFLKLKNEGTTRVSLQFFYEEKLQGLYKGPSMTSIRRWAREQK